MKLPNKKMLACAAGFLGSFLFLMFQGGRLAFMLFIVVSLLTIYVILGFATSLRKATGRREMLFERGNAVLRANSPLTVRLYIRVPGLWPVPYVLACDRLVRENGDTIVAQNAVVLNWKREGIIEYRIPKLKRGHYRFERTTLSTTDIFGWFEYEHDLELAGSFSVLPQKITIRHWNVEQKQFRGFQNASLRTTYPRETTQLDGVRDYQYGDRISRIHWNATARTGTWKSKEFEKETLAKTILVLDRNQRSYQSSEQFELAVSTAASLLDFGQRRNLSFGLLSVGRELVFFEPGSSSEHYERMLHHLIGTDPEEGQELEEVMRRRHFFLAEGGFFAMISADAGPSMVRTAEFLTRAGLASCLFHIADDGTPFVQGEEAAPLEKASCRRYVVRKLHELPMLLGGRA